MQFLKRFNLTAALPYFTLLIWIVPLLLLSNGQQSLLAYDEGLYAWRSRWMVDTGDWLTPWSTPHHKTPGSYWLIASTYTLFGISDTTARLPSILISILNVLLTYEIGKILLGKRVAWLAAAILSVEFFWVEYSRLANPDIPMICVALLGILCLLRAELHPNYRGLWSFGAGLSFGLGFFLRSFMIFVPVVALLPYLIGEHRRHQHLSNPMLYLGFAAGLTPTFIWLWASWQRYGTATFKTFFSFFFKLASEERYHNGPLYYLWNIPAKTFPWSFFSLLGLNFCLRNPIPRYQLLLVGFPLVLLIEISFFSTRIPHYALVLYPFIALLAGLALQRLGKLYQNQNSPQHWLPRRLSYLLGGFSCLLLIVGVALHLSKFLGINIDADILKYGIIAVAAGLGWMSVPAIWISRYRFQQKFLTARYWIAGWLVGSWLALAVAGFTGILGDYNPDLKPFLQQPAIASVLQTHSVNLVDGDGKTAVLLKFYTPHFGQLVEQVSDLPDHSYTWIPSKRVIQLSSPYQSFGTFRKWQLVQVLEHD